MLRAFLKEDDMRFRCPVCGRTAGIGTPEPRCSCGALWELDHEPEPFSLDRIDKDQWSIFRYRRFMALEGDGWRKVTMGEGMTPVTEFEPGVLFKMDYFMPTLSFKDRGAAVIVANCLDHGITRVVQDSSGNAGNSVAAYCARAGIECGIFVPEGTSPKKIDMIRAHGAECTVIPGSRDHCAQVCRSKVEEEGVYYANHVFDPLFYEGTKTYIYEVFEQLGRIPEAVLIPTGNGTLYLGVIYGLEHLLRSGCIEKMPQIIAVQSENCDPLLKAAQAGMDRAADIVPGPTIAEGIAIGKPARDREILRLARLYGVRFVHAPEDRIMDARAKIAAKGIYCEHTTAANYAGYEEYCRLYGKPSECLIPMCGAGLKSDH